MMRQSWKPLKPNDLATIQTPHSTRRRVVEVISRQTPEQTIMIRRTPGDPTTLEEVRYADLIPFPKHRYIHVASVDSRFGFPEDMLRYDCAFLLDPDRDEEDEHQTLGKMPIKSDEPILVYSVSNCKTPPWTTTRWNSFSAWIKPVRCFDLTKEPFVTA